MKVLVISDSHSSERLISAAYEKEKPDTICFLGDGLSGFLDFRDFELPGNVDTFVVCGNCDREFFGSYAESQVAVISGIRFFMAHGHTFSVRSGVENICTDAYINKCGYCLYGHTHKAGTSTACSVTAVNPGALENGEYCVISIEGRKADISLKKL